MLDHYRQTYSVYSEKCELEYDTWAGSLKFAQTLISDLCVKSADSDIYNMDDHVSIKVLPSSSNPGSTQVQNLRQE
jgi:hypothetical protein